MWSSRITPVGPSAVLALGILTSPTLASAQKPERAELIQKAQEAKASGDHVEALRLAREAGETKMTASLRRFLVEEESALGRWIDAYSDAQKCTREAATEPPSPNHDAVLVGCRALLHSLREHVGLLVFDFASPPPPDLRITIDGRLVEDPFAETEHPASLGEVAVEATASGRRSIRRTVQTASEPAHVALAFAEPSQDSLATPVAVPPAAEPVAFRTVRGPSGPIVAGIGLAAGIAAIVTRRIATGEYDDLEQRCHSPQGCPPDRDDVRARIERFDNVAFASAVGGAALLGLGATLYFFVDKRTEPVPNRRASLSIEFDPRTRVVTCGATF